MLLKPIIQRHYRDSPGQVAAFGSMIGYTAVTLAGSGADFGFGFDVTGNGGGPMREVARLGKATLGVKRGDIG
jgi:hypothetical protein